MDPIICDESGVATSEICPSYQSWTVQDQALMKLVNATLSPAAISHFVGYSTFHDVWCALERRFSSISRANIL